MERYVLVCTGTKWVFSYNFPLFQASKGKKSKQYWMKHQCWTLVTFRCTSNNVSLSPLSWNIPLVHLMSLFILMNTLRCSLFCCHIVLHVPTHEICSALLSPPALFQHKDCPYMSSSFFADTTFRIFSLINYEAFFSFPSVAFNRDFYLIFKVLWTVHRCDLSTIFLIFFVLTQLQRYLDSF